MGIQWAEIYATLCVLVSLLVFQVKVSRETLQRQQGSKNAEQDWVIVTIVHCFS